MSVVIPAHNAVATIGDQLEALSEQLDAPPFEVIVADNGSVDGTVDAAAAYGERLPWLRIVDASSGMGASAARNAGVRVARGELILFCDADDRADPGWVSGMVAALEDADVVGGRLRDTEINDPQVRCWYPPAPRDLVWKYGSLPYASGASLGIRRHVLEGVHGWDETFVAVGGEDADLSFRAQLDAGATMGFAPQAVMEYRLRHSLVASGRQARSYGRGDARIWRMYGKRLEMTGPWRRVARAAAWLLGHFWYPLGGPCRRGRWHRRANVALGSAVGLIQTIPTRNRPQLWRGDVD